MGEWAGRRRARTERDVARLCAAVKAWAAAVLDANSELRTRHTLQVERLRDVFVAAGERILRELEEAIQKGAEIRVSCDDCDRQLSYLQSAFDYYVERL